MKSLEDRVRARKGLGRDGFRRHLFWSSIRWYSTPTVALLRACHPTFFEFDDLLLTQVARATSLREVKSDIMEYRRGSPRGGLLRGILNARISTRLVYQFAERYFAADQRVETTAGRAP